MRLFRAMLPLCSGGWAFLSGVTLRLQFRMSSTQSLLEQENNRRAEELSHKVTILKSFAKDIETETKEQNAFLDQMRNSYETAHGLLSNTLHQVFGIPKHRTQNRRFMCYLILFVVVLIVFCYLVIFRSSH
ncbi:Blocked early in transport 1 [Paragonimus heterotremus]|uniref:Blocked early in transport 1 n=1 Tax=Paragonimus heterotremus TaxID=100268 RepID=A0A8J4WZZ4_9TREM|nr:Blocked early in transport 1 [Paragonimus heterotremus]